MTSQETAERVLRVILECGHLGVKPTPQTIAEIMVDQDVHSRGAERQEAQNAYAEYAEAATRALLGPSGNPG